MKVHVDCRNEDGSNSIFPRDIAVHEERRPCGGYYEYRYDSDEWIQQYETIQYIPLQRFLGQEVEQFLFEYAVLVPRTYHNDIAILIQGLRDFVWPHKGSGGPRCWISNGMVAAKKFSRDYNAEKRVKWGEYQFNESSPQEVCIRQQQQRAEAAQPELDLVRQKEVERRRLERAAEERKQQQIKRQEEAARDHRNAIITDYMYKLETSQVARADRKNDVEKERQRLEDYLSSYFGDVVQVQLFGSLTSGLGCMTSDADFTLHFEFHNAPSIVVLADALHIIGCQSVTSISHA
ncbi:hypothetical protein BGZ96_010880 [Linnemannia gamsii]|uniref:Poly(A) RNA polymerase mitochondrial-like central palm domain-containing protein n=1 Tax=Linnemannia gamsii TaxID=64522 RepID=A0ABQ7JTT0_9FUNG|nr:hypothetical protein BGZ96_010880 [Linnemannia gamsii]